MASDIGEEIKDEIASWRKRSQINRRLGILCQTLSIGGAAVGTTLAALGLNFKATGVVLSPHVSLTMLIASVIVGSIATVAGIVNAASQFSDRWKRMRQTVDELTWELRERQLLGGPYQDKTPEDADRLLASRCRALSQRGWGWAPQASLPQ